MSLELNYVDAPEGAQEKMTPSSEGVNSVSDGKKIATGARDIPYATLEPGVWKLDGTRKIMPDVPDLGWWSKTRSGESSLIDGSEFSCRFLTPPTITITFPVPYSSTGFTFTFSPSTNQWCSELRVLWYNGQNLLLANTYHPDSPRWVLDETVESFDRIVLEVLATNEPGQFAKISRIEIGKTVLLGAGEIISAELVNEIDPSLCELTVDTLDVEIHDAKNRNFLPQENQRIELIKDGEVEAVQYITSSTRKAKNDYSISCQSAIGLLNDTFLGGLYFEKPLAELVSEILGSWEYKIDPYFSTSKITGYLPVCSQREALQQVAFAVGAIVTTQKTSEIRFVPVPKSISGTFTANDIFLGGNVKTAPRIARAEIYSHSYTKTDVEETLMDEEELVGENVLITFTAPHYDYTITGGTITGSGDNWVTITANGLVTLKAKTYLHTTKAHVRRNPEATAKERGNVISVPEATLIHSGNAQGALDRLYAAKQWRQTVSQNVAVNRQRAGQQVSSLTPWESIARGFINSMESSLTQNGHTAMITIQGIEVALDSVWMYSGEIYSGGMEVVY